MIKKDLVINLFFGILIISWNIFLAKIIIYHGLGYMGSTGGFKLDAIIITAVIMFNISILLLFTFFNRKK